jgi:Zn-dependent protease with chaperone function
MIRALQALQRDHEALAQAKAPPALATMQISGRDGVMRFFMSHPPLEQRIERLRSATA